MSDNPTTIHIPNTSGPKGYKIFNLLDVRQAICDRLRKEGRCSGKYYSYIFHLPDNTTIEDFPIYRDYLSQFSLTPTLEGKHFPSADDSLSETDYDLLFKLICGSFSSSYDLTCNEQQNTLEITLHVQTDKGTISKRISELEKSQIQDLFVIFLDEQLWLAFVQPKDGPSQHYLARKEQRRKIFEQKTRALEDRNYLTIN
ncbi:MAG: hypothetical protein J5741_00440 [Bacteroidales bacterium]|nr:hypothetical protein [Bacteroidales bacterium]